MTIDLANFITTLKSRVLFDISDQETLKTHADWANTISSDMAAHFYHVLSSDPEMNQFITATPGRIERLSLTFIDWFNQMFTGIDNWNIAYAERRWKIGLTHVKVGIMPQHVVPSMAAVSTKAYHLIKTENKPEELLQAFNKICMIDLTFIECAYIEVCRSAVKNEMGWSETLFKRLITQGVDAL